MSQCSENAAGLAERLQQCALFRGLPPDVITREILPRGRCVAFAKQAYVVTPSERVDRLGVILSGVVHILNLFSDGRYSLMSALSAPKALGADLVCTKSRRPPYYAMCATPVEMLFFPSALFLEPGRLPEPVRIEILNRLLTIVSQENMQKYYRLAILSQKGLRERVVTYLSMQARRRGADAFEIPFSREELAAFLCVDRSALSHELSLMKQEGLLDFRKNAFTLLAPMDSQGAWWKAPV